MRDAEPRPLTATLDIDAPPHAVWQVVSAVRRTGEWSPECRQVIALGRVRRGTLLLGRNRRGRTRWITVSRIVAFDPDRAIEWTVLTNRSRWRYEVQASARGTLLVQTRRTPRCEGRFAVWFTRAFLGGQQLHDDELESGMAEGLDRIRAIVAAEVGGGLSAWAGRRGGDRADR